MRESDGSTVYEAGTRVRFTADFVSDNGWIVDAGSMGTISEILPRVAILLDERGPDNEDVVVCMKTFVLSEQLEEYPITG